MWPEAITAGLTWGPSLTFINSGKVLTPEKRLQS